MYNPYCTGGEKSKSRHGRIAVDNNTVICADLLYHKNPLKKKVLNGADRWFKNQKLRLSYRLELLSKEEVAKLRNPFHIILLHNLAMNGYIDVVKELHTIFQKEIQDREKEKYKNLIGIPHLIAQKDKLELIAYNLKLASDLKRNHSSDAAILTRLDLAEKLLKMGDFWLAKHFYFTLLSESSRMEESKARFRAEVHCILAYLIWETVFNHKRAINHLKSCRRLSKGKHWQLRPGIISIKLQKPITVHGLREEYEIVDGSAMTLYFMATLFEYELEIGLANDLVHFNKLTKWPTKEESLKALEYAYDAFNLAFEVRQSVALSTALIQYGSLIRHTGNFDSALEYFRQLQIHSELTKDVISEAIAFHNIGLCMLGKHDPIQALENLAKQREIARKYRIEDLSADALQEIGHILLNQGQLWESEECYILAFSIFRKLSKTSLQPFYKNYKELVWGMLAVSTGQKIWARFSGLCRRGRITECISILKWKLTRENLPSVPKPNYELDLIEEIQTHLDLTIRKTKMIENELTNNENKNEDETALSLENYIINYNFKSDERTAEEKELEATKTVLMDKFGTLTPKDFQPNTNKDSFKTAARKVQYINWVDKSKPKSNLSNLRSVRSSKMDYNLTQLTPSLVTQSKKELSILKNN